MGGTADDDELLAEQRDFYRADADAFDGFLGRLVDEDNDDPVAVRYRSGRALIADVLRPPIGRVLEIAAGTGRLAELYVDRAVSTVLLDASPESLALAASRVPRGRVDLVGDDAFTWDAGGRTFDTIIFSAWLHHVPHSRFDAFWRTVGSLLAVDGQVIFDFPDATIDPPGRHDPPEEPTEEYGFYAPVDGISIRDHFGRRWRVVHNLWHPDQLAARLAGLGWRLDLLGPGMFDNVVWARADLTGS